MIELYISSLITFFVVIDPPGCAPIYAGLSAGASTLQKRAMAMRAVGVAAAILFVFALFGEALLKGLGISLASFRIAGGIMLFLIALEMVFEKRTERREDRAAKVASDPEVEDVSIFPMAMPMIAGPGSIASVMLLMSRNSGIERSAVVLAAMVTILLLTLVALLAAGPIMRILGAKIEAVITRLLGVLLAALAVQFVLDGLSVVLR
ncbi:multiple antibiotic resistance protein [Sphingomonas sp. PP-CE-3G-477]|uniref:MarC family protein n=1 Tax=unclassified Sphingomonas TaxID=196159 RepID=UPI000D3BC141|nr:MULTISPECIES: MarC family protein [unclassified Sphingomonas]MBD8619670.1 MarC family protein [Sphingomonas sp. CFBP 13728]MBE2993563.1 MarC family protein [Sphingomonas sp. CFBP 13603]PTQ61537.1 multiple antibiotic resistance protein [Sphingomonas sp. PP-CE-3G-477]QCB41369.1 MarC family protein [Sphingomonas sp. PAMC26645]